MRDDLITVVTGEPRSGTSLQMRTLDLLGVPVEGALNPRRRPDNDEMFTKESVDEVKQARDRHASMMNPLGYYELPGIVNNGTRDIERFKGKVIKVVSTGAWPKEINGNLIGMLPEHVYKYILCLRHPRHVAVSQQNLMNNLMADDEENPGQWAPFKQPLSLQSFMFRTGQFVQWISEQGPEVHSKFVVIKYDDMIEDTRGQIERIIDELDISPTPNQIQDAIDNINKGLRRSNIHVDWPSNRDEERLVAQEVYESLETFDIGRMKAAGIMVEELLNKQLMESVRWVDDEDTWATISPSGKRLILSNEGGTADNMRASLKRYRKSGMIPDQCSYYSRDNDKIYVVRRPPDLGDLERPMVHCGRDNDHKTVEQCKHCWQYGWVREGETVPAQRSVKV